MNKYETLEFILEKLREVATVTPANLAIYIAETAAMLRTSDYGYTEEDITWFDKQVDQIVVNYMGGDLFHHEHYPSDRQTLM